MNIKRLLRHSWAYCLLGSALWSGCQTTPHLVLDAVGPSFSRSAPSRLDFIGTGFLVVYSGTEEREVGKFNKYYIHTPYLIYSSTGQKIKWVENSSGSTDEAPARVRLPAGNYSIRAQDDNYGRVTVPVVIQDGQTTIVSLETRKPRFLEEPDAANAVQMPDGRIVGWRAKSPPENLPRQ